MASFALVRVLGNDLPPLHRPTQTLDNLRFLLAHEPALPGCRKQFILNRIADPERREALRALVEAAGHPVDAIEIDEGAYCSLDSARDRGDYLSNNNGARNRAIELGLATADVVLPFDGQTFFTLEGWQELRAVAEAHPKCPAFVVPMVRLLDNAEALGPRIERQEEQGPTEPQLAFTRACRERFDERVHYGRGPKVELLIRLGVAGPWDEWVGPRWTRMRAMPRAAQSGQARSAGFVYRLASGNSDATVRVRERQEARKEGLDRLVARVDEMMEL